MHSPLIALLKTEYFPFVTLRVTSNF